LQKDSCPQYDSILESFLAFFWSSARICKPLACLRIPEIVYLGMVVLVNTFNKGDGSIGVHAWVDNILFSGLPGT